MRLIIDIGTERAPTPRARRSAADKRFAQLQKLVAVAAVVTGQTPNEVWAELCGDYLQDDVLAYPDLAKRAERKVKRMINGAVRAIAVA